MRIVPPPPPNTKEQQESVKVVGALLLIEAEEKREKECEAAPQTSIDEEEIDTNWDTGWKECMRRKRTYVIRDDLQLSPIWLPSTPTLPQPHPADTSPPHITLDIINTQDNKISYLDPWVNLLYCRKGTMKMFAER